MRKIKMLGRLMFKLETRSKNGSRRKLVMIFLSYLLPGAFVPFLIIKQSTDPTGFEFAFITFLFFSTIICFTIITELDNFIISKTEIDVLGVLPINSDVIVRAKVYVMIRYIFLLSLPLLLPGSIFYYFLLKSVSYPLLYFISGNLLFMFLVFIILLIYSVALRNLRIEAISIYTLILQILLIFTLIIGYQYASYMLTNRSGTSSGVFFNVIDEDYLRSFFPQSWFAFLAVKQKYLFNYKYVLKLVLPFFICYMSYLSFKLYMLEHYKGIRERFMYSRVIYNSGIPFGSEPGIISKALKNFIEQVYLRNIQEHSSFKLMQSFFKRDKAVRINILSMIIIPTGLALFALFTNQLPSPFAKNYFDVKPVFHVSILLSMLIVINACIVGMKVSSYAGASWVYNAYPVEYSGQFINGVRKFFFLYLILPLNALLFFLFSFKMPFYDSLIHILFILAAGTVFNTVYHVFNKGLPFTKESTMINSIQKLTSFIFPLIFGIIFIIIQFFVYPNRLNTWLTVSILLIINYMLVYVYLKKDS
ncbi:MAG: hypothetical protein ACRDFC_05585 [Ignavibacteria bacterium]